MKIVRIAGLRPMVALLGLAACSTAPSPSPPAHVASTPPLKRRWIPHPPRAHANAALQASRPPVTAEPLPAALPAASFQPVRVTGWPPERVRAQLGSPDQDEVHGSVRIWTYHAGGCGLRITFYYDVIRSGFFALSQKWLGDDEAACNGQAQAAHAS
jgi:hypothetical protein